MNKLSATTLALALTCVGIAGCSTNTQGQNTGLGAVTGGVVGGVAGAALGGGAVGVAAGAIAGAVIGGFIGHNMDYTDQSRMNSALNDNRRDQATTWTNSKTGTTYRFVPTSRYMMVNGNPNCRKYYAVAKMSNGHKHKVYGVACRQADGTWQSVK